MKNYIVPIFPLIIALVFSSIINGQDIPEEYNGVTYRGDETNIARGVIDGNLIETNFRNHGELSRWNDLPWGVWPRTVGGRHIDGVAVIVAGYVISPKSSSILNYQDYLDWNDDFRANGAVQGREDTVINPLIINYREAGRRVSPYVNETLEVGQVWGWLPLPGFNNASRTDPVTGNSIPTPALSNDETTWPDFWPDKIDADPSGWPGTWNGRDGRFPSADLESYYVIDDYSDLEYAVGLETDGPHSALGVYHPTPLSDSTKGGFGMQMKVRLFQWANVLAEDTMFLIYRISNKGDYGQERLFFAQIVDYGLGNEENDDNAAFDDLQDVVYGWDSDGIGTPTSGGANYNLGYTGFAFLESPANDSNGEDDDLDGIIDESRFDENYLLLTTQAEIDNYTAANYDLAAFETFHEEPVSERDAYKKERWFTTDENLDWVGFTDDNENGIWDEGESLNSDVGVDGLGPFDLNYPGPDEGEGNGIPNNGEPNYNELDVDESDQIGLRGFDLDTRPNYESGNNLQDDTWLFGKIEENLFSNPDYVVPSTVANNEPFILFVSGEVELGSTNDPNAKSTDFFSTAWIFGNDEEDFFKNRRTVQSIYNADYNFAQPPTIPTLTATAGDNQVILSWDTLSVASYDRFLQDFDFEGYKLYKSTNNVFTDIRTITNVDGTPTFYEPLAQFDLDNGISGPRPVFDNEAIYDMGDDTGLQFYYVDNDVTNGKTYYYAVVAYDRGTNVDPETGTLGIDPQENTFRVAVTFSGEVAGTSINAAVVVPQASPAGYVNGSVATDLSSVTEGSATGYANVDIIIESDIDDSKLYEVTFQDSLSNFGDFINTTTFSINEKTQNISLASNIPINNSTEVIDGFVISFANSAPGLIIENKTGYVSNEGGENELFNTNPSELDGFTTDWQIEISPDDEGDVTNFPKTDNDYEILFVDPNDSTYTPPFRFGGGFKRFAIPIFARNTVTGELTDIFIRDLDNDGAVGVGDHIIISELNDLNQQKFKFRIDFISGSNSNPPSPGDKIKIATTRQFGAGDKFLFTLNEPSIDNELAKSQLDEIYVAPNPYVGAASWERASNSQGRGERKINFFNLPQNCTVRIFNVRGELVRTLEHSGTTTNGMLSWDLLTENNEDIAYGVYFYHVEAPGIGEFTSKFAIVK